MNKSFIKFKELVRGQLQRIGRPNQPAPRRRGSMDDSRAREIADASPERAGELAGHPVERVDT